MLIYRVDYRLPDEPWHGVNFPIGSNKEAALNHAQLQADQPFFDGIMRVVEMTATGDFVQEFQVQRKPKSACPTTE